MAADTRYRITNRYIEIDGERKLLIEWAELYGLSVPLILDRLKRGWDEERAITKPARKYRTRGEVDGASKDAINGK